MSLKKEKRQRRTHTPEFKQQIVDLYRNGKQKCDIIREYDLSHSLLDRWIAQANHSGSFKEKDNRTPEQEEIIRLRKENQQPGKFDESVHIFSDIFRNMIYSKKLKLPIDPHGAS